MSPKKVHFRVEKKGAKKKAGVAKVRSLLGCIMPWFQFPHSFSPSFQRPVTIHLGDAVSFFSAVLSATVKNPSIHQAACMGDLALVQHLVAAGRDCVNAKNT
jgi:hypothetical protein